MHAFFWAQVRSYRSELVSGRRFGRKLSIYEWHYIPEWHSECTTIPTGNRSKATTTQTSHIDKY